MKPTHPLNSLYLIINGAGMSRLIGRLNMDDRQIMLLQCLQSTARLSIIIIILTISNPGYI